MSHVVSVRSTSSAGGARLVISGGGGGVPPLDGEVTSAAQIISTAENAANAGKVYWMRGGSYGTMTLDSGARPSSTITFRTYPGEQVTFGDVRFEGAANLTFDGNENNRIRAAAGGYPDGDYGLWFRGSGTLGYDIPDVNACITMIDGAGATDTENIELLNFRLGDDTSTDFEDWRKQHGMVFLPGVRNILCEDFEIGYVGLDMRDQIPGDPPVGGDGDQASGGFGLYFIDQGSTDWGDFTFRRGHFHHTMNDCVQYGPNSATALCWFDTCMFEELENFGTGEPGTPDPHCDFFQIFGGSAELLMSDCVFRNGTDFLWHGDVPGEPRTFTNCLFGDPAGVNPNVNNPTLSKSNEGGIDAQWVFEDCSMEYINSLRLDSTAGSSFAPSPKSKIRNSIYPGFSTETSVNRNNVFENDSQPNKITDGGTGVTGDSAASPAPTYNADGECTNYSQGWRMPVDFPWSL